MNVFSESIRESSAPILSYASCYIECGATGMFIDSLTPTKARCFAQRLKYHTYFAAAAWGLIVLHLFERPAWTYGLFNPDEWMDASVYPSFGLARCPLAVSLPVSTALLVILAVTAYLEMQYEHATSWKWLASAPALLFFLVGLKLLENGINLWFLVQGASGEAAAPLSFSPAEGAIVLLVERRFVTNILYFGRILPKFGAIVVVLTVTVLAYTSLSFVFFAPDSSERVLYFSSLSRGLWSMFMVLCGSNWPNPIVPAYGEHRLSVLYFVVYLVVFNWGMLNFVLGLLCSVYRDEQRELGLNLEQNRLCNLRAAFSLLDPTGSGFVRAEDLADVVCCLYADHSQHLAPPSADERSLLVMQMMGGKAGGSDLPPVLEGSTNVPVEEARIGFREFCRLHSACGPDALRQLRRQALQEALASRKTLLLSQLDTLPSVPHYLVALPFQSHYDLAIDGCMLLLGIAFLVSQHIWVAGVMLSLQCMDIALTIHATSLTHYLHTNRGWFDLSYAGSQLLVLLLLVIGQLGPTSSFAAFLLSSAALVRLGAVPRSILYMESLTVYRQKFVQAFRLLALGARSLSFLLTLLFVFMYAFADLGVKLFGGLVREKGLTGLVLSLLDYGALGYWPVNMNDMFSALATVFLLLHVNNTHVYAEAFEMLTGSAWARLFFAAWYVLGVLLLLNLFTAFFLNGFLVYLKSLDRKRVTDFVPTQDSNQEPHVLESAEEMRPSTPPPQTQKTPVAKTALRSALATQARSAKLLTRSRARSAALSSDESDSDWLDEESGDDSSDDEEARRPMHHVANMATPASESGTAGQERQSWLRSKLKSLSRSISYRVAPSDTISYFSGLRRHLFGGSQRAEDAEEQTPLTSRPRISEEPMGVSASYGAVADISKPSESSLGGSSTSDVKPIEPKPNPSTQRESLLSRPHRTNLLLPQDSVRLRKQALAPTEHTSTSSTALPEMISEEAAEEPWLRGLEVMRPQEVAAVLVQCAGDGVHCEGFTSRRALLCFRLRHRLEWLYQSCAWVRIALFVLQQPLWMRSDLHDIRQPLRKNAYPLFGCPYIPLSYFPAIQAPLLCLLLVGLLLELGYQDSGGWREFISKSENICRLILIANCVLELVLTAVTFVASGGESWLLWSALSAVAYVFWFDLSSRWKLEVVLRIVPRLIIVLAAFALLVILCASFGPFIFGIHSEHDDDDYNQRYFSTFPESVWSVFVAITSSSFPNQVMPLYRQYHAFILYIVACVGIGAFGALNFILVFVLSEYRKGFDRFSDATAELRETLMLRAFDVLDTERRGWLTYAQTAALLEELYTHYSDFRRFGKPSRRKRSLLIKILDIDGDGVISAEDFGFLIEVTRIRLKQTSDTTFFDLYFPTLRRTFVVHAFITFFQTKTADLICDLVVVSLIIVRLVLVPDVFLKSSHLLFALNFILLVVFLLELLGGLSALGLKAYQLRLAHRFNFALTSVYSVAWLLSLHSSYAGAAAVVQAVVQVVRLVIFPRVVFAFFPERMATVGKLLRKVIRRMASLAVVLICSWYLFAVTGVYLFGGLVNESQGNSNYKALRASVYGRNQFWDLNFNDMPSALVTLFCCLHVSDFDVITAGFVAVTNKFARVYFVAWYVVGVLLLLNIIKSFFLTEFLPTVVATLKPEETRGEQAGIVPPSSYQHIAPESHSPAPDALSPMTPRSPQPLPQPLAKSVSQTILAAELARSSPMNIYSNSPAQRAIDDLPDDQSAASFSFVQPSPAAGTPEALNILNSIQSFTLYSNDTSVLVEADDTEGDSAQGADGSINLSRVTELTAEGEDVGLVLPDAEPAVIPATETSTPRRVASPGPAARTLSPAHSVSPARTAKSQRSRSVSPMASHPRTRDNSPQPARQSLGPTKRYEASTEFVADLDAHDLQLLHERLRQISAEAQAGADLSEDESDHGIS